MKIKHIPSILIPLFPCFIAGVDKVDLIAYWPRDEGEGFVATDTIGGADGQITGGSWFTPGKVGAAAFQGTGDEEINGDSNLLPRPMICPCRGG